MEVHILPKDFITAFRLHQKPRRSIALLGLVLLVLFAVATAFSVLAILRGHGKWDDWAAAPAIGLYFGLVYWVFIPARLKKLHAQQRVFRQPITIELEPSGVYFGHSHGSGVLPWSDVHKWRESKELFLIYHSDALYNVVPKRYFASSAAVEEFRSALRENAGPANNSFKPNPLRGSA